MTPAAGESTPAPVTWGASEYFDHSAQDHLLSSREGRATNTAGAPSDASAGVSLAPTAYGGIIARVFLLGGLFCIRNFDRQLAAVVRQLPGDRDLSLARVDQLLQRLVGDQVVLLVRPAGRELPRFARFLDGPGDCRELEAVVAEIVVALGGRLEVRQHLADRRGKDSLRLRDLEVVVELRLTIAPEHLGGEDAVHAPQTRFQRVDAAGPSDVVDLHPRRIRGPVDLDRAGNRGRRFRVAAPMNRDQRDRRQHRSHPAPHPSLSHMIRPLRPPARAISY